MNQVKGYALKIIKKMIDDSPHDFEKNYLVRLQPEQRALFNKLAISWVPIPSEKKVPCFMKLHNYYILGQMPSA